MKSLIANRVVLISVLSASILLYLLVRFNKVDRKEIAMLEKAQGSACLDQIDGADRWSGAHKFNTYYKKSLYNVNSGELYQHVSGSEVVIIINNTTLADADLAFITTNKFMKLRYFSLNKVSFSLASPKSWTINATNVVVHLSGDILSKYNAVMQNLQMHDFAAISLTPVDIAQLDSFVQVGGLPKNVLLRSADFNRFGRSIRLPANFGSDIILELGFDLDMGAAAGFYYNNSKLRILIGNPYANVGDSSCAYGVANGVREFSEVGLHRGPEAGQELGKACLDEQ